MKKAKRTNRKFRVFASFLLIALAAFLFVKMVQMHVQIDEQQGQLESIQQQIKTVGILNEDLSVKLENLETSDGQQQQLRDNGYVDKDDQVYIYATN